MCIWLYALTWCIMPLFGFGEYVVDGIGTSCTFNYLSPKSSVKLFIILLFVCGFCLPCLAIMASYMTLYRDVRRYRKNIRREMGDCASRGQERVKKTDVRLAYMSFQVVALFCLAWLPYAIVAMVGLSGHRDHFTPYISLIPAIFAKSSAGYNPILYSISYKTFRAQLRAAVCGKDAEKRRLPEMSRAAIEMHYQDSIQNKACRQEKLPRPSKGELF